MLYSINQHGNLYYGYKNRVARTALGECQSRTTGPTYARTE